ncbi:hypothetical protein [Pseudomonas sp. B33.4]|uniref:hypothetical protein n=1 Tax=Pseudomonas sp. B33.4 TaxID=3104265 RepID=UPI002ADEFAAD|nr:hypothetical protein [Pseudomonas sp. B33.4]
MLKDLDKETPEGSEDEGRGLVVVTGSEGRPHVEYVHRMIGPVSVAGISSGAILHSQLGPSLDHAIAQISATGTLTAAAEAIFCQINSDAKQSATAWVIASSHSGPLPIASEGSQRIRRSASEMLKDPKKVRAFFARVNGEATAN